MPQENPSSKKLEITEKLVEKVTERVMELLRKQAQIDNERRGRTRKS